MAGKHLHLGCHDSEVAAAQAFDQAVMLRHVYCRDGETSVPLVTNFPPEYYQVCCLPLTAVACAACDRDCSCNSAVQDTGTISCQGSLSHENRGKIRVSRLYAMFLLTLFALASMHSLHRQYNLALSLQWYDCCNACNAHVHNTLQPKLEGVTDCCNEGSTSVRPICHSSHPFCTQL